MNAANADRYEVCETHGVELQDYGCELCRDFSEATVADMCHAMEAVGPLIDELLSSSNQEVKK